MKGLIVGHHSFLAQAFWAHLGRSDQQYCWERCSHGAVPGDLSRYDWVLNFSYDPRILHSPYSECHDPNTWLAERIRRESSLTRLVMLSTRKVYPVTRKLSTWREEEADATTAQGHYGRNKWRSEQACRARLPEERLLILRCANLIGWEPGRPTFMGMAQTTLMTDSVVRLDTVGAVQRDFLPALTFCEWLASLLNHDVTGTYNLGSGQALRLDTLCQALIEGYGQGQVVTNPTRRHDAFVLDMQRLKARLPALALPTADAILAHVRDLGIQLAKRKAVTP